jgi:hypothetical protein
LRDAVIAEVREKRGGHGQHKNTVWDEEIVCSTSAYSEIAGKTILLVTREDKLITAAAAADATGRVCSVEAI